MTGDFKRFGRGASVWASTIGAPRMWMMRRHAFVRRCAVIIGDAAAMESFPRRHCIGADL